MFWLMFGTNGLEKRYLKDEIFSINYRDYKIYNEDRWYVFFFVSAFLLMLKNYPTHSQAPTKI